MKRMHFVVLGLVLLVGLPLFGQVNVPRVSQKASVMQTVGLTEIEIVYSRPGVKGREIWGELVPWNELWRTGANEATSIEFSHNVKVEGYEVPAGKYALFTIPARDAWTVILNSDWDQGGTSRYDEAKNVATFQVTPASGPWQEWMAFHFPDVSGDSATIELAWKETRVPIRVEVDTPAIVMEGARELLGSWANPYRAADYAFSQGIVTDETMDWIDRSIALQENWRNVYLKARMLAERGDRQQAIATAERALQIARSQENPPSTEAIEADLAEWRK